MEKKRALVLGCGGLRGAYDAGVVATLCRTLGPNYFNGVYATSVGTCTAPFFVAGQPDTIENTWRNLVHGRRVVNLGNVLRRKPIVDVRYLVRIFQGPESRLDLRRALRPEEVKLIFAVTEYTSGSATYHRPNRFNVFDFMRASAALPLAYGPVEVDGGVYIDGGLSDPLPIVRALHDGYDEVMAVWNKPKGFYVGRRFALWRKITVHLLPEPLRKLVETYETRVRELDRLLTTDPRITVIRPSWPLPLKSILDTNRERLNQTFDIGVRDASSFFSHRPSSP